MLDATPIPRPERERPDLYVRVYMDRDDFDDEQQAFICSRALLRPIDDHGPHFFRLPGNRRAKLQADATLALGEWNAAWLQHNDDGSGASHVRFYLACKRLSAAYTALAELDAKQWGEK